MDVCLLDLPKKFDMVIMPFNSFAHIVSRNDQKKAIECVYPHLLPGGHFICTLGNPAVRQKAVDDQMRLFREYPLPDAQGALLLWIVENHVLADDQVIHASQFYEEYGAKGILKEKRLLELHFRLSRKDEFEKLATAAGFTVKAFYGDYTYTEWIEDSSPFMIWILEKAG